ncbi:MAG: alpha/beta fold hydrolase [Anaerolineales bacterium]|nr:alpha/beta fold hydrolase [Anaerolineales bacterium]
MSKEQLKITFPIGFHSFHKDQAFNFQLNRWYSLGYGRLEDLEMAGAQINNPENWKTTMLAQAEKAVSESRFLNAAYYFRAAEFFLAQNDPDKIPIHQNFIRYFIEVFENDGHILIETPYGSSTIPTIVKPSVAEVEKGTIILHGGYDSYKEELYPLVQHFSELGYKVITFECPWMKLTQDDEYPGLDFRWEKIIKAILDHLSLDDVTLIGISMGGWLSLRAAAFEPRIKRVIASSVSFDVNQYVNPLAQKIASLFFTKFRNFTNKSMISKMKKDIQYAWFVNHLMAITNQQVPIDAFDFLLQFNEENLHSEKVKQDVLILTGQEDHMIPLKTHHLQVKALTSAKSITARIFTKEDQAQNHCQVGNLALALNVMVNWIQDNTA